jgi:ankyrin repeat protein
VEKGDLPTLKDLLRNGTNVNAKDFAQYGGTPLMLASKTGNMDIVNELIKHGAKINDKNIEGFSPIIIASENGQLKVANELIRNGADLKEATNDGNTALIWAVRKGNEKILTGT